MQSEDSSTPDEEKKEDLPYGRMTMKGRKAAK
jgi:hypothetical protein